MVGPRETELTVAYGILAQPPGIGDDGSISIVGIVDNSMDDKDTPVYERPPAPRRRGSGHRRRDSQHARRS